MWLKVSLISSSEIIIYVGLTNANQKSEITIIRGLILVGWYPHYHLINMGRVGCKAISNFLKQTLESGFQREVCPLVSTVLLFR